MPAPAVPRRRRRAALSRIGLPLLCLGCLGALVFPALVVRQSMRLTNPPGYEHQTPAALSPGELIAALGTDPRRAAALDYQDVAFPTADGATLRGWLVPGPAGTKVGVVAAHARAGDRRGYLDQLPLFHGAGYTTLLFDYREHGVSDGAGRGMSLGYREAQDVSAAVRYLKDTVGLQRVVVIGHSLGGSAVVLAGAQDPAIDGVIADSSLASFQQYVHDTTAGFARHRPLLRALPPPPQLWSRLVVGVTTWRIGVPELRSAEDVVGSIAPRPLLLMHGTADGAVEWAHSQRLFDHAGEPKELWIAEGADHNLLHQKYPQEYRRRVTAFLQRVAATVS